jgi:hypothetical protein
MGAQPSDDPPASGRAQESSPGEPEQPHEERCGPVAIARHVKDDGRALILYSHASDPPQ